MTAQFAAEEVLEITKGRLAQGMMPDCAGAICSDTRTLSEGQWYLALVGENFDGHDFIADAFTRGAIGCIVQERQGYAIGNQQFPLIAVGDTLAAYHDLARAWRLRCQPKVVAITGSSGKTTTKEMCASVVAAFARMHKSQANENNEIGLAKTILAMPENTEVLILELAMRAAGEIGMLARTALVDIGVIVNVGTAHLGRLASLDAIIQAKCELLEEMDPGGAVAVIGQPTEPLMKRANHVFTGKKVVFDHGGIKVTSVDPEGTHFALSDSKTEFFVKAHGASHLQDAWCALMVGKLLGADDSKLANGLRQYSPVSGRGVRKVSQSGAVIVDESYNANPDSVKTAIEAFVDQRAFPQAQKFVVLGELAELGDETEKLHRELGTWIRNKNISALITVGAIAKNIADGSGGAKFEVVACSDQSEAQGWLDRRLAKDAAVLIKGSRCAQLDHLVLHLVQG
jgi:UDP-N-acetylmuramoyl-tripeptide--D-alanyl-D-alanine ligase